MASEEQVEELFSRADSLYAKFERGRDKNVIDEAVSLYRVALALCPPGHSMRSDTLRHLSFFLSERYNQFGQSTDLEEAIVLAHDALSLCPSGHPSHSDRLDNLALRLSDRYQQSSALADLEESIDLGRAALELCPQGNPDRLHRLNNLGIYLSNRYERLGRIADLNECIVLARDALQLTPLKDQWRASRLDNLGARLSDRYNQLGTVADLHESISLCQDALALCPIGHPERPMNLNNLGNRLSERCNLLGLTADLDQAIIHAKEALSLCPPGHPTRSTHLSNFASHLSSRYEQQKAVQDIDNAISLSQEALALCPQGHPSRSRLLNNLANNFSRRFRQLNVVEDIEEAISLSKEALALCPLGHPLRSWSLDLLAGHLSTCFAQTEKSKDKRELFDVYVQISHLPPTASSYDLSAAKAWIGAAEEFRHPTTVLAYETALRFLIHQIAILPSLPQHLDVLKKITSSIAMDAFSACLRYQYQRKAVELLEQGRGVFWGQLNRIRSPLEDVVASGGSAGTELSDKFKEVTARMRDTLNSAGANQHDKMYSLNVEFEKAVADIRGLPGLSRFLLPSLFPDLQQAASRGPVIIVNASKYGCDVLVVLADCDPVHIPLQITKGWVRDMTVELHTLIRQAKESDGMAKYFAVFLRKLWTQVVSPVVDFLRTVCPPNSRIWWCPTAGFCHLPLHAAGPYRNGERGLSDLYISSYTPSLTALIHARAPSHDRENSALPHFVAIGEAGAAGQQELLCVGSELASIHKRLESLTTFKCIEGSNSSISHVVDELTKNEWVHFACHGVPNQTKPFESALVLHDGHLTIEHIMRCDARSARFAYLSACHTTVGDEECPDEMIHLAQAVHFSGFRSVVGTMWGVDDSQTMKLTSTFYDHMVDDSGRLDHTRAAFALRKMQRLRSVSFDQRILYIHIGA